jgi:hypothetical protein
MTTRFSPRPRFSRQAELTETGHETVISRYFQDYLASGDGRHIYVLKHPIRSLGAFAALYRLPCLYLCHPSPGSEGTIAWEILQRHSMLVPGAGFIMSALRLPREPGQYSLGAAKQTLRRKIRKAERLGIYWAEVQDAQERLELLKLADDRERTHPDAKYRNSNPDNADLLSYELWLAAYSAEGRPLLLSVTPVDGDFAYLRHFRTLGDGEEESNARYLMTDVLAEHLVRRRARYLLDCAFPAWQHEGLRHFQRMIGYETVRIRVARSSPGRRKDQPGMIDPTARTARWRRDVGPTLGA